MLESNLKKYYKFFFDDEEFITIDNLSLEKAEEIKEILEKISLYVKQHYGDLYNIFEDLSYSEYFMNSISDKELSLKIFKNIDIFNIVFEKLGETLDKFCCGKATFFEWNIDFFFKEIEIEYYSV